MAQNYIDGRSLNGAGGVFVSALQTGTGSAQSIAHTLGRTPTKVVAVWQGTGVWTVSYGVSTDTNIVLTATNTATFIVIAW